MLKKLLLLVLKASLRSEHGISATIVAFLVVFGDQKEKKHIDLVSHSDQTVKDTQI